MGEEDELSQLPSGDRGVPVGRTQRLDTVAGVLGVKSDYRGGQGHLSGTVNITADKDALGSQGCRCASSPVLASGMGSSPG